jgi:segregation and condensation protein B
MDKIKLKNIVEALLMASDRVLTLAQIEKMLTEKKVGSKKDKVEEGVKEPESMSANDSNNETETEAEETSSSDKEEQAEAVAEKAEAEESVNLKSLIKEVLENLQQDYTGRAMELKEVASGFRFQVRQEYADHVGKLWEERPSKYSRALLETLVLIAYRQPITRGEIEAIRGVSVSSHIIKTLVEREWVRVIGHRDVPGKPAIFGSTKEFLDYFNLKSLDELPSLAEIKDLDKIAPELALEAAVEAVSENISDDALADDQADSEQGENTEIEELVDSVDDLENRSEIVEDVSEKVLENAENMVDDVSEVVAENSDDEIAESDENDSGDTATSQENEPDNTELS